MRRKLNETLCPKVGCHSVQDSGRREKLEAVAYRGHRVPHTNLLNLKASSLRRRLQACRSVLCPRDLEIPMSELAVGARNA